MPCPENVAFNPMDIELMISLCWDATRDCSFLQSLKPRNKRGCHREVALLGLEEEKKQLIATAYCYASLSKMLKYLMRRNYSSLSNLQQTVRIYRR